jgi:hypothetical protein
MSSGISLVAKPGMTLPAWETPGENTETSVPYILVCRLKRSLRVAQQGAEDFSLVPEPEPACDERLRFRSGQGVLKSSTEDGEAGVNHAGAILLDRLRAQKRPAR